MTFTDASLYLVGPRTTGVLTKWMHAYITIGATCIYVNLVRNNLCKEVKSIDLADVSRIISLCLDKCMFL